MVSDKEQFSHNDTTVKPVGGTCTSYNIVYLFECRLCGKHYVGRSTRILRTRVGEHRRNFYKVCEDKEYDKNSDEFALGHHLAVDHNLKQRGDFDLSYSISILDFCSPMILEKKEHAFIHALHSLIPNGINIDNPFSIPLLYK